MKLALWKHNLGAKFYTKFPNLLKRRYMFLLSLLSDWSNCDAKLWKWLLWKRHWLYVGNFDERKFKSCVWNCISWFGTRAAFLPIWLYWSPKNGKRRLGNGNRSKFSLETILWGNETYGIYWYSLKQGKSQTPFFRTGPLLYHKFFKTIAISKQFTKKRWKFLDQNSFCVRRLRAWSGCRHKLESIR